MLPLEVGELCTHALAYPQMDWWMSSAEGTCLQKVSLPPQCEGELMQVTLVTSSGKRETCGLYCLDVNPSNASISVSGSDVNIQCKPEEDSWQLNIEHLQQRVSSRQL